MKSVYSPVVRLLGLGVILILGVISIIGSSGGGDGDGNRAPTAQFSATPISGEAELSVTFDASASSDPDGNIVSYSWDFGDGNSATGVNPTHIFTSDGSYVVTLTVTDDDGATGNATQTITVYPPNQTPTAAFSATPTDGHAQLLVSFDASASSDPDGNIVTYNWDFGDGNSGSGVTTTHNYTTAGSYSATLTVTDNAGATGTTTQTITVNPPNQTPSAAFSATPITGWAPLDVNVDATASMDSDGSITSYSWDFGDGQSGSGVTTSHTYTVAGSYTITLTIEDDDSASATATTVVAVSEAGGAPPEPSDVAPDLDATVTTTLGEAVAFLYSDDQPIQTGVDPATIDPKRIAVLRGTVRDREGEPIPSVTISVHDHPEFGQTLTRELTGMFDLAVNGGGLLTVDYRKDGYLPVQRQIRAPWQDYVRLPDVVMIVKDSQVTGVDLTTSGMKVARSSEVTDDDGTRQGTIFIPEGTGAQILLPGGGTQAVDTLNIRITEYTIGDDGPDTMPAQLPAASGYTYAFEISTDEAQAKIDGKDVLFDQPVYYYVENFLGFPPGMQVPTGYYDPDKNAWIPSDDGRVIKIMSITNNMADVDVDGDDMADTGTTLTDLGFTDAERLQLASLYTVGQTLWRVGMTHFSTSDCNWPFRPPNDGVPPNLPNPPNPKDDPPNECKAGGSSTIWCRQQALGETVDIVGTPFNLNYRSDRTLGRKADSSLNIPLRGESVPASLLDIRLLVDVAGKQHSYQLPTTTYNYRFQWDTQDDYERTVQGIQPIKIRVGYEYQGVYRSPDTSQQSTFGAFGLDDISFYFGPGVVRDTVVLWQDIDVRFGLGQWDARGHGGIGGWTLNVHHAYDPLTGKLYKGDGTSSGVETFSVDIIDLEAGGGDIPAADDVLASEANLGQLGQCGIAVGVDGAMYLTGGLSGGPAWGSIVKIGADGLLSTVGYTSNYMCDVVVAPDNSLYISTRQDNRILRVTEDGTISTVAGNGTGAFAGDGGLATEASLLQPEGIALAPDGTLYIADFGNRRIRRVGVDGIITTIAGTGDTTFSGDGGLAKDANLNWPMDVAVGPDGSIYISDFIHQVVRRIDNSGIINTVAGSYVPGGGYSGDGGPATEATLSGPQRIALDSKGNLYIADTGNNRIRRVGPDGIINTFAGTGFSEYSGDNGPAAQAGILDAGALAIGSDDSVFIVQSTQNNGVVIRKIRPALAEYALGDKLIASNDSDEVYVFDQFGKHLRTVHSLTGATLYEFRYNENGLLSEIEDGDQNITTIQRSGDVPTAIVSPYGQTTTLSLDANGYLALITNPASESYSFTYNDEGLMIAALDPNSNPSSYQYDDQGRLARAEDAVSGYKALSRIDLDNGYEVTKTSALNRVAKYRLEQLTNGDVRYTNTFENGASAQVLAKSDGTQTTTYADGTIDAVTFSPDPRFGMRVPIESIKTSTTPNGLVQTVGRSRSVVLTDPANLLSVDSLTDTKTENGQVYLDEFNGLTRQFTLTTPEGRQQLVSIDEMGRVVEDQIVGLAANSYSYDTQGRLETITQGSGVTARTFTQSYGADGFLDSITNPLTEVLEYDRDLAGRVTQQTLSVNKITGLGYDAKGNLISVTPPQRPAHIQTYTDVNLLESYQPPDISIGNVTTSYAYNLDRQPTAITHPDGQAKSFNYNAFGQLSSEVIPARTLSYTYLSNGLPDTIGTAVDNYIAYSYDGLLSTDQQWAGASAVITGSVEVDFNNDFNQSAVSINGTDTVSLDYDNDQLLIQAGALTLTRYPQTGLVEELALGNVVETYTYNTFGELEQQTAQYSSTTLYDVIYGYDDVGRVSTKSETIQGVTTNYTYHYDAYGQLEEVLVNSAIAATYDYDLNGNRLSHSDGVTTTTGSYDNQDRLETYGNYEYNYNANGDLQSKRNTSNEETDIYVYDFAGDLTQINLADGTQINYIIDSDNRRVGKQVDGVLTKGWLYQDHLNPVAELDDSNNVVSRFVYASKDHVPDYMIKAGTTYRMISDHLGSVRLVVDVATGTITQRLDYDEFGIVTQDTNPGFQPFAFAGGLYEPATQLVRYGARDYDATVGRWLTKDPVRFDGDNANLYAYVVNNPVNFIDANGQNTNFSDDSSVGGYGGFYDDPGDLGGAVCRPRTKEEAERAKERERKKFWRRIIGTPWKGICSLFNSNSSACGGAEETDGSGANGVRG